MPERNKGAACLLAGILLFSLVSVFIRAQTDDSSGILDASSIDMGRALVLTAEDNNQTAPQIAGNFVVWENDRNSRDKEMDRDIYLTELDLTARNKQPVVSQVMIAGGPSDQYDPKIIAKSSGVFAGYLDYNIRGDHRTDLWGYEIKDGRGFMIHNGSEKGSVEDFLLSPAGVYYTIHDEKQKDTFIWSFDYESGNEAIITNISGLSSWSWFNGKIVCSVSDQQSQSIYGIEPETGEMLLLAVSEGSSMPMLDAWEDRLVWSNGTGIYLLENGREPRLIHAGSMAFDAPSIFGNIVMWHECYESPGPPGKDRFTFELMLYDLSTDRLYRLTNDSEDQMNPVFYGCRVVWQSRTEGGTGTSCSTNFHLLLIQGFILRS